MIPWRKKDKEAVNIIDTSLCLYVISRILTDTKIIAKNGMNSILPCFGFDGV